MGLGVQGSPDIGIYNTTVGGGVTGSGTPGTIPIWTGSTSLGDSLITYTTVGGNAFTVNAALTVNLGTVLNSTLVVQGVSTLNGNVTFNGTSNTVTNSIRVDGSLICFSILSGATGLSIDGAITTNNTLTVGSVLTAQNTIQAYHSVGITAPFNIPAGTLVTTLVNGNVEFDGTHFYGTIGGSRVQLDNGGVVTTIGTIDTNGAAANGASISGNSLFMQSASATVPGLVNLATQSFKGQKNFTSTSAISSGTAYGVQVTSTLTETGTSGHIDLYINRTETSVGSGSQYFIRADVGGTSIFTVDHAGVMTVGNRISYSGGNISIGSTTGVTYLLGANATNLGVGSTGIFVNVPIVNNTGGSASSSVNPSTTGTVISSNMANANVCLTVNQINVGSTGNIANFQFNNATVVSINTTGTISATGMANLANPQNAIVGVTSTGVQAIGGISGTNPGLTVILSNPGSTGNLLNLQNSAGVATYFTHAGAWVPAVWTNATRPSSPAAGTIGYNTDQATGNGAMEYWSSGLAQWVVF